jgi:hypothetical protein
LHPVSDGVPEFSFGLKRVLASKKGLVRYPVPRACWLRLTYYKTFSNNLVSTQETAVCERERVNDDDTPPV